MLCLLDLYLDTMAKGQKLNGCDKEKKSICNNFVGNS